MLANRWIRLVILLLAINAQAFGFANFTADITALPEKSGQAGSSVPVVFDPVTLTNLTASPLALTLSVATNVGGNWLSASYAPQPLPANGESTLTITASTQGLDPLLGGQKYLGFVTVRSPNNNTQILITVVLSSTGSKIVATPFPSIIHSSIPAGPQSVLQTTVTVSPPVGYNNATVGITADPIIGAGWLSVDTAQLFTPSTFKVNVDTSALAAGTYTGTVAMQYTGVGSPFQEVDLTVFVTVVTMVPVPNVVGSTQAAATTALQTAGLVVGNVSFATSQTVPAGSVISQNPTSGTQVEQGSAVNLTLSTGPESRVISHLAAGGEWTTGILVLNKGLVGAQFSITFYGDNGQPVALPFSTGSNSVLSDTVPAQGSAYYEASDPNINFISAWGKVTADPAIVIQAIFRRKVRQTFYYEAAVPTSASAPQFIFPFDATIFTEASLPFFTGIAIANQDPSQIATVTCTARDPAGVLIPNAVTVPPLAPLGHWADFLFPVLTGKRGTITCTSNTMIATTPLRFIGVDAFSTLPVIDPSQPVTPGIRSISHLAAGGEWTTGILLLNTGIAAAQFSISFHGDTGIPVSLPFSGGSSNVLAGIVPARGSAYFEASNPSLAVISAWGRVTADPSIVVQAIFRRNVSQVFYEAAVSSTFGSNAFIVPFDATTFADANLPFFTGFAVANTNASLQAVITCVARDTNGVIIPNAVNVPVLAPLGHWADFLFPALTGKRGTITCTSDRLVATTVLRFIGIDGFSTLPVVIP